MARPIADHVQGVNRQAPIQRVLTLSFDEVRAIGSYFHFYQKGVLVGTHLISACTEKQRNFFDAISIPPG